MRKQAKCKHKNKNLTKIKIYGYNLKKIFWKEGEEYEKVRFKKNFI